MNKPSFIAVGPARAGSSWLYQVLNSHPSISISKIKETEFSLHNYFRSKEWYESLFSNKHKVVGEISTSYFCENLVPLRIYKYNPNIKIIFCIRNPISLLNSLIGFAIRRGIEESVENICESHYGEIIGTGYKRRKEEKN